MKYLQIALLLSLPFLASPIVQAKENRSHAKHFNLGQDNEHAEKTIAFIDGKPGRMDANIFAIMLDVRNKIKPLLSGYQDPQNPEGRIGHLTFHGERYSIDQLANIEENYVGDAELNTVLIVAKKDFEDLIAPFMAQARGTKSFLTLLIATSCRCHNRKNSLLLTWANSSYEHETVIFHTEIQSFRALSDFCHDLINFLEDMMVSCPIAKDQFKKKREQYTNAHNK